MINSKFILMYHVREFEVTNNKVEVVHEVQPSLSSEGGDTGLSPVLRSDTRESTSKDLASKLCQITFIGMS